MEAANLSEQKKQLRQEIRVRKKQYSFEELQVKSQEICRQLEQLPEFQSARSVLVYCALADEVATQDFIARWYQEKTIFLPAIVNDEIEIRLYAGKESLQTGEFSIAEPCEYYAGVIDLAIIPGLAFDRSGNRLGRGKGFYDRFLAHFKAYKIGICFDFQLLDCVPAGEFDIKMNLIIYK